MEESNFVSHSSDDVKLVVVKLENEFEQVLYVNRVDSVEPQIVESPGPLQETRSLLGVTGSKPVGKKPLAKKGNSEKVSTGKTLPLTGEKGLDKPQSPENPINLPVPLAVDPLGITSLIFLSIKKMEEKFSSMEKGQISIREDMKSLSNVERERGHSCSSRLADRLGLSHDEYSWYSLEDDSLGQDPLSPLISSTKTELFGPPSSSTLFNVSTKEEVLTPVVAPVSTPLLVPPLSFRRIRTTRSGRRMNHMIPL